VEGLKGASIRKLTEEKDNLEGEIGSFEAGLKNNYLTFRSTVKVPRWSLRYATHLLMVMPPHTKYNLPI
jgi:hypothetical protein